jgi:hypothetical protein
MPWFIEGTSHVAPMYVFQLLELLFNIASLKEVKMLGEKNALTQVLN